MTTTKSYLAGLGMTGIVIGSVLVLLAVGTGLVAFDGARDVVGGRAPLERVVVGNDTHPAGGERGPKRPDAPPAPATAARLPVAPRPVASQPSPSSVRRSEAERGRGSGRRAGQAHGGARVRTRGSLGGGAPVGDASENGGGAAAGGPPGRTRRGAHTPPGRSRVRAPSTGRPTGRARSTVPGPLKDREVARGSSPGIGRGTARGGKAVDSGALPAPLP